MSELHLGWPELRGRYLRSVERLLAGRVAMDDEHREQTRRFAAGRIDEGRGIASFLLARGAGSSVLDLGAGDGGTSLGVANFRAFDVIAADLAPNGELRKTARDVGVPLRALAADGQRLPLDNASIDNVLCLDVIEHIPRPERLAAEIMRVLRPGGLCMVTTPARLRHLLGPDPHFGVRGLLLLPDGLQKHAVLAAARRRTGAAVDPALYDVRHIYWHASGVARLFPEPREVELLWDFDYPGPTTLRNRAWYIMRKFLWNRIIIRKNR